MLASFIFTLMAGASVTLAAPTANRFQTSLCNVTKDTLAMPSTASTGSSPLAAPIAGGPKFIGLGVGVQNYTCSYAGTYTSTGAYAQLFDLSCLPQATFTSVTDAVWSAWQRAPKSVTAAVLMNSIPQFQPGPVVLGQHYFITNPITGSGLSPKWDFTSASKAGNPNAFVVAAKTGDVPAPTDPTDNVDWLSLKNAQGDLATQIFRMETRGGQPPASCTAGSADISVNYVAQYWLYGGSV